MRGISKATLLVAVATLLVATAGCSSGGSGGPQATPKDTVMKMFTSMQVGDKAGFMQCLKISDAHKKFVEATFDVGHASYQLHDAIRKEYGDDGLAAFLAASGGDQGKGPNMPTREQLDKMQVKIDGDKATVTIEAEEEPIDLVKEGGKWYATMSGMDEAMMAGPQGEMALKMIAPMTKAMDDTRALVGKSGQTPESIAEAMKQNMMKAIMGGGMMQKMMEEGMKQMAQPPAGDSSDE